jgi:hypothetical protein
MLVIHRNRKKPEDLRDLRRKYDTVAAYINDVTVRNIIRESSLRLRAKGGVVPHSVLNLPYSCEHQI